MQTKKCTGKNGCGKKLPIKEFRPDNRMKSGLASWCKKRSNKFK